MQMNGTKTKVLYMTKPKVLYMSTLSRLTVSRTKRYLECDAVPAVISTCNKKLEEQSVVKTCIKGREERVYYKIYCQQQCCYLFDAQRNMKWH